MLYIWPTCYFRRMYRYGLTLNRALARNYTFFKRILGWHNVTCAFRLHWRESRQKTDA
jgi:hypothetical protein